MSQKSPLMVPINKTLGKHINEDNIQIIKTETDDQEHFDGQESK